MENFIDSLCYPRGLDDSGRRRAGKMKASALYSDMERSLAYTLLVSEHRKCVVALKKFPYTVSVRPETEFSPPKFDFQQTEMCLRKHFLPREPFPSSFLWAESLEFRTVIILNIEAWREALELENSWCSQNFEFVRNLIFKNRHTPLSARVA